MPCDDSIPEPTSTDATTAVVLVNLGTPDAPTAAALRRYLAEFLDDRRVVELPRWLWWPLLHGLILRTRPRRSARAYAQIWTPAGSPLRVHTEALATALGSALAARDLPITVHPAMRYGEPGLPRVLRELAAQDLQRLLVVPLYPQYSATTTASVFDAVARELERWRRVPALRFVRDYHDDPAHVEALARSVEGWWATHGQSERLQLSFHGIPERYVRAGDPYAAQCQATAAALRMRLGLAPDAIGVSFQSRLGRARWLGPYTDAVLHDLPARGVRRVQVLCPGFAVDCLETLEEIGIRYRALFLAAGGEAFDYIPALNDGADQVAALVSLVRREIAGWPGFAAEHGPDAGRSRA